MALVKEVLKQSLFSGLQRIFTRQSDKATSGDESEDPNNVIKQVSNDMADVIADAVDAYLKSGDIMVGPDNIAVMSSAPGSPAVVTPVSPAKII